FDFVPTCDDGLSFSFDVNGNSLDHFQLPISDHAKLDVRRQLARRTLLIDGNNLVRVRNQETDFLQAFLRRDKTDTRLTDTRLTKVHSFRSSAHFDSFVCNWTFKAVRAIHTSLLDKLNS